MRNILLALALLSLGVLLTLEEIGDAPARSVAVVSGTAGVSLTPRAEAGVNAKAASNVPVATQASFPTASIAANPAKSPVDGVRSPAGPKLAAIGPALRTGQVVPGSLDHAKAIASVIDSPEFQDTVSPLARLYFAYFGRFPDYEGLNYYVGQREGGRLLDAIADEFATSREIEIRYGSLDNAAFVDRVYRNVFEGAGDAQQRADWIAQLESGAMTRGQMMLAFSESAAFRTATASEVFVSMAYAEILGRSADPAAFARWVAFLDAGHSGQALIQGLLASR